MESIRIVKLDDSHFSACVHYAVWGANKNILNRWRLGDYVIFKTDTGISAAAKVNGAPFTSEDMIWENDLYPYRIPLEFIHIVGNADLPKVTDEVKKELIGLLGNSWGFYILRQQPLPSAIAQNILNIILNSSNEIPNRSALKNKQNI